MENSNNQIQLKINQDLLGKKTAVMLKELFEPYYAQAQQWKQQAEAIVVTDISQKKEMADAREFRLQIKKVRTTLENKRKEIVDEDTKKIAAINSIAREFKSFIEPIEEYLQFQEDFFIRYVAQQKEERKQKRLLQLKEYEDAGEAIDLLNCTDEVFNIYLDKTKIAFKVKQDEAQRAKDEADRIAKEKEESERQAKIIDDRTNERIKKVSEIGLIWNEEYQSFIYKDVNISLVEIKTDDVSVFDQKISLCSQRIEIINKQVAEEQEKIRKENERLQKEKDDLAALQNKRLEDRKPVLLEIGFEYNENIKAFVLSDLYRINPEVICSSDDVMWEQIVNNIKIAKTNKEEQDRKTKEDNDKKEKADKLRLAPDKDKLINLRDQINAIVIPESENPETIVVIDNVKSNLNAVVNYISEKVEKM